MSDISSRGYANADKLVSTEWVAANLNDPNVRVVESNEDPLLYPSGHIPGAVEVDWVKDLNDPLRRDYLDQGGFRVARRAHRHHARDHRHLSMATRAIGGRPTLFGSLNSSTTPMPKSWMAAA